MEEQKTINGVEFEKKIKEQTPKVMNEVHKLLESLCEDGKYHIVAITSAIGEIANQFGVGFDQGYNAGRLDILDYSINSCQKLRDKLLGLDSEEEDNEEDEE